MCGNHIPESVYSPTPTEVTATSRDAASASLAKTLDLIRELGNSAPPVIVQIIDDAGYRAAATSDLELATLIFGGLTAITDGGGTVLEMANLVGLVKESDHRGFTPSQLLSHIQTYAATLNEDGTSNDGYTPQESAVVGVGY